MKKYAEEFMEKYKDIIYPDVIEDIIDFWHKKMHEDILNYDREIFIFEGIKTLGAYELLSEIAERRKKALERRGLLTQMTA